VNVNAKDWLLSAGVTVALILSAFALLLRPGEAPDRQAPPQDYSERVASNLEDKLAEGESRVRGLEDRLGRIEKRIANLEAAPAVETPAVATIELREAAPENNMVIEWEPDVREAEAPAESDVTRGLVAWYKFDDKRGSIARDSSGKGHNGRLVGRPKWTTGRLGGALEFDGRDDFVELARRAGAGFMHDAFRERSICLWVRQNAVARAGDVYDEGGTSTGIAIRLGAEGLRIACSSWDSRKFLPAMPAPALGTWHHVAVVFNRGALTAFVDGRKGASARAPYTEISKHNDDGGLGACARSDVFGRRWGTGRDLRGVHFTGLLDDVRIYDRALAPEEVEALVTGRAPAAPGPAPEDIEFF